MRKILLTLSLLCVATFSVQAQVVTVGYTQDFESFTTCATGCGAACALTAPWVNAAGDNLDWLTDISGTSSTNTGPTANGGADHNPGISGGKYLYIESSCSGTGYPSMVANLHTPMIDLNGANAPYVEFWYHMYGTSQGTMHVDASTDGGTTWSLDIVSSWTDNQDIWQLKSVDLTSYVGDTVMLRIRGITGTSFGSDMAIDDFSVHDLLPNDAGVCAIDSPSTPACNLDSLVYVSINNYGTDTLTQVSIEWSVNAVSQPAYAWTGSLAPGEKDSLIFIGSYPLVPGDDLCVWTSMPNGMAENATGAPNDTMCTLVNLGLNGVYSVGGAGADYPDIASTVADLEAFGVCGPVVFELYDTTFNEQITLGEMIGMNSTNTVTYRSASGNAQNVIWSYSAFLSTENWTLNLDGGDYFHFEDITLRADGVTYGRVINVMGGATYNVFDGNIIQGDTTPTTTSTNMVVIYSGPGGSMDHFNTFSNNTIQGGSYGMYWYGDGTTALEEGTVVEDNLFLDQYYYGARLYYMDYPAFNGNTYRSNSTYTGTAWAFYFYYCDNEFEAWGNTVEATSQIPRYGIYMVNCDGANGREQWIGNNMITVGTAGNASTFYGVYCSNNGYQRLVNNNIYLESASVSSRGIYITGGGLTEVVNNCIQIVGGGYGLYYNSSFAVTESNYNNVHSDGNYGYFNAADQATLADWQGATGSDAMSWDVDPNYYGLNDLHVCNDTLDGAGTYLSMVPADWDGQSRNTSTPDIGADEFTAVNTAGFLGADQTICTGDSVVLMAGNPGDTIMWSTGSTDPSITVGTAGTYTVTVSGPCGTGSDTIVINQSAVVYSGFLSASATEACEGDTIWLDATMPYDSYSWSNGDSTMSSYATTSGTYTLDVADACGSGSESVTVNFIGAPTASFTESTSWLTCIFTNASTNGGGTNTYSWDFGDGNTSTLENPVHVYAASGSYTVTLVVDNGCGTDSVSGTCVVTDVGVDEALVAAEVSIYPNPSNGFFTMEMFLQDGEEINLSILDLQGRVVYDRDLGYVSGLFQTDVAMEGVSSGTYFLKLQTSEGYLVKRIIVE